MKIGEKKMGKKEMSNIHAGTEKSAGVRGSGTAGKEPGSKCTFAAGSCCQRTHCPSNSNG